MSRMKFVKVFSAYSSLFTSTSSNFTDQQKGLLFITVNFSTCYGPSELLLTKIVVWSDFHFRTLKSHPMMYCCLT